MVITITCNYNKISKSFLYRYLTYYKKQYNSNEFNYNKLNFNYNIHDIIGKLIIKFLGLYEFWSKFHRFTSQEDTWNTKCELLLRGNKW